METLERRIGVNPKVTSFTIPLGATINMDGTAIYQGVCAVFIAQIYGIDLSLNQYLVIVFTATLASIGTAGIPGAGLIMLSMVLASVGLPLTEPELRAMHRRKTGALLLASVRMGAACAAHPLPAAALQALDAYGQALGLAFQVVDDVLDVTADSALLGKTAGKDAAAGKPTYVSLLGLEAARQLAADLLAQAENALNALQASGLAHTQPLHALARQVVQRQH